MITALPRIAIAMADYEGAVDMFRTTFGLPVLDFSPDTVPSLGAHVGMCMPPGGSNIELMAPANPELPLSQALQKFLDVRGEGFYAVMLEAPEPNAEAADLLDRGVEVLPLMAGAGGRDIHPRSTHGILIRVYPNDSVTPRPDLRSEAPGLSGIGRAIVATEDAAKAAFTYGRGLGLTVDQPVEDAARGVLSVRCRAPKGGDIELVSVVDAAQPFGSAIAAHLAERREGLYAIELTAPDRNAAVATLVQRGLVAGGIDGREFDVFGARILIA